MVYAVSSDRALTSAKTPRHCCQPLLYVPEHSFCDGANADYPTKL